VALEVSAGRSRNAHCLQAKIHTAPQVIRLAGRFFKAALRRTKDAAKASQSFAAAAAKESLDHFLRRHVRRRKYRSACKRARRPPRRMARALQQAANPFVKKVLLF